MARLVSNTTVQRPGVLGPVVLMAGDEVPAWAAGLVGEHLFADETEQDEPAIESPAVEAGEDDGGHEPESAAPAPPVESVQESEPAPEPVKRATRARTRKS